MRCNSFNYVLFSCLFFAKSSGVFFVFFFFCIPIKVLGSGLFSSVTQSCLPLCDPLDCSMPGLPVHHQLPELAQTHVHPVSDAIQPSHPLSSPSQICYFLLKACWTFDRNCTESRDKLPSLTPLSLLIKSMVCFSICLAFLYFFFPSNIL